MEKPCGHSARRPLYLYCGKWVVECPKDFFEIWVVMRWENARMLANGGGKRSRKDGEVSDTDGKRPAEPCEVPARSGKRSADCRKLPASVRQSPATGAERSARPRAMSAMRNALRDGTGCLRQRAEHSCKCPRGSGGRPERSAPSTRPVCYERKVPATMRNVPAMAGMSRTRDVTFTTRDALYRTSCAIERTLAEMFLARPGWT